MRKSWAVSAASIFLAISSLVVVDLAPAHAESREQQTEKYVVAEHASRSHQEDVIYGGKVQSTDPRRYDYLPPEELATGMVSTQDAYGATFIPAFNYSWGGLTIPIPGGLIEHGIYGQGLRITRETAAFGPLAGNWQICNHQWQLQNRNGNTIYSTIRLPVQTGCRAGFTTVDYRTVRTVRYGQVCARLYVAGYYKGQQCHHVYP